ncbi:hypothetical protein AB6A23_03630 [Paenibacillus tarimensis]
MVDMVEKLIVGIKQDLIGTLSSAQLKVLEKVLNKHLATVVVDEHAATENVQDRLLSLFIAAKRVEGCSEKTLRYYESIILNLSRCSKMVQKNQKVCPTWLQVILLNDTLELDIVIKIGGPLDV